MFELHEQNKPLGVSIVCFIFYRKGINHREGTPQRSHLIAAVMSMDRVFFSIFVAAIL